MKELFRRLRNITIAAPIICAAITLCGCVSESDIEENESQKETIISYLEGSHSPSLIAESEVSSSLDLEPAFYTSYGDFAFRYISIQYDAGRDEKAEVKSGSSILINFRLHSFSGSAISDDELPVYTNEAIYKSEYEEAGLNLEYWTFLPMEIIVGKTTLLSSIQDGLIGCREGDIVELYMTRNMAYGDDVIGLIDQWSSLVFFCTVLSVEN
ncbi:MAG: hypothetical protein SNG14_00500 [Rikenellaceae bacterium]